MTKSEHYSKLENMYLVAPINKFYLPEINISEGKAAITTNVKEDFFHAANAVHGSVYFKMLDDAAFFAANSIVEDVFVLTVSFQTELLRPINTGKLIAKGELLKNMGDKFEARAKLFNEDGKLIATGSGVFVKSKMLLAEINSYKI
ncbi:MAG: thioesterase [Bacteroidetes bacterium RIFCSPLOWO2_12_FULL_31_6]|nr:MAG: thioesterase [Bacteroidetes bacterium RIFCSPLOWO2_12_FULL_31_6]